MYIIPPFSPCIVWELCEGQSFSLFQNAESTKWDMVKYVCEEFKLLRDY